MAKRVAGHIWASAPLVARRPRRSRHWRVSTRRASSRSMFAESDRARDHLARRSGGRPGRPVAALDRLDETLAYARPDGLSVALDATGHRYSCVSRIATAAW